MSTRTRKTPSRREIDQIRYMDVMSFAERRVITGSQFTIPNGSDSVTVELCSQIRSRIETGAAASVTIEVRTRGGPAPDATPMELWPADLPVFIAALIRAAYLADRDAVIPPLRDAERSFIHALAKHIPGHDAEMLPPLRALPRAEVAS